MSYNAKVQYTAASSGDQPFGIPFTYIDQKDIIVKVDGVQVTYTWLNPATVSVTVQAGQIVEVIRDSSSDHLLVEFKDGSILKERDLNTGFTQAFFLGQEAKDRASSSIELDPLGNFDAKGHRIIHVENPVNDTDAVNKRYLAYEYPQVKLVGDNMGAVGIVAGDLSSTSLLQMDLGSITQAPAMNTSGQTGSIRVVADSINHVRTVANDIAKVTNVSDNITDVGIVSDNIVDVVAVGKKVTEILNAAATLIGSLANMNTVAAAIGSVNTVATDITKVNTVSADILKVKTVAENVAAVVTAATNIAAILDAPNQATAAANSASSALSSKNAAATSASNAATSATNAAASETAANNSKNAAATSATNAATSATQAATSATNAANSATSAADSAAQAQYYAQQVASGIPNGSITSQKLATTLDLGSV